MESFQAAALAEELGVPFAAVRVVADPLERELPPAVHSGLQTDGSVAIGAVIDSLAREPGQLLSLARVTVDAYVAFRALLNGREKLGPRFASLALPDRRRRTARAPRSRRRGGRRGAGRLSARLGAELADPADISDPQRLAEACAAAMWANDRASEALGMRIVADGPGEARLEMPVAPGRWRMATACATAASCSRSPIPPSLSPATAATSAWSPQQGDDRVRRAGGSRRHVDGAGA